MSFYSDMAATASRLISKFGTDMTFRSLGTPPDPVTGLGGTSGVIKTLKGIMGTVDDGTFPDGLVKSGDRLVIVEGGTDIEMSDVWVNGSAEWSVVGVKAVKPDNSTTVISKVLVRG